MTAAATKTVPVGGAKNGKTRVVPVHRAPKWYPAEDVKKPLPHRKRNRPTKLRASLVPGTVLILLAGRFRGQRVVFLKQLPSGLLLVSGPHKLNGVPLRRVDQAYVIATDTRIDIAALSISDALNDALFKKPKSANKSVARSPEALFNEAPVKKTIDPVRIEQQKAIDAFLMAQIAKTPLLKNYLKSRFSLSNGQLPHLLKF